MSNLEKRISALEQKIQGIDAEREKLLQELTQLKHLHQQTLAEFAVEAPVTQQSANKDKVKLFRDLFKGRDDVYPKRWENSKTGKSGYSPACSNEWKPNICGKPRIKCGDCQYRSFLPVSDQVITNHLAGSDNPRNQSASFVIGVYPLTQDERCWFLAVDFDKAAWQRDVILHYREDVRMN